MERIISEIKTTADIVAKKSTELVELSKVKLNIANTKSKINTNFRILGEMIYISQKDDDEIYSLCKTKIKKKAFLKIKSIIFVTFVINWYN